jgi:hypothetical protein
MIRLRERECPESRIEVGEAFRPLVRTPDVTRTQTAAGRCETNAATVLFCQVLRNCDIPEIQSLKH